MYEDRTTRKLTDWENEPKLAQLKEDFEASKPAHDAQMLKIQRWNDLMQVSGSAKPKKVPGRSSVQPKLIRRQAEWRYSALTEPFLSNDKVFSVSPTTFEDKTAATQNSVLLNWQFRTKIDRVKFIDNYVRSTVDEGTSIIRVGWQRVTVQVDKTVPVYSYFALQTEEELTAFGEALDASVADPRGFAEQADPAVQAAVTYYRENQIPTRAEVVGEETVKVEKALENRPILEVIEPNNFYIDPSCLGDVSRALFAVVSFETNKADLLKQPEIYKNLDIVNWEASSPVTNSDHTSTTPTDFQLTDALRKKVVAYEYWGFWDIGGEGVLEPIVATWIGDVLIRMERNPFPDKKIPFVMVNYLPVKRDLYGETDAELLEDNQKIIGALTRGMIDLMGRSANSQKGYAKGMLDVLNKRRFESGQDYEFNPGQHPAGNLQEHTYPEIPNSALVMLNLQNAEAEALTGVKSFSGGISGDSLGDVATAIRGALDAASKREMAILRRLAKGLVSIGMKLIAMNAVFLSEEEVVRVTNEQFVTIKRDDLQGDFDLEVDISTAELEDAKAKDLAFVLQTLGPNSSQDIVFMVLAEICELKRLPDLAEQLRTYDPQPTPEQQQLQQLELLKAQLEVEEIRSRIALNEARAKAESSKGDKLDLDYVEQETGTKHARDLEKQQGQARGNQELEITKSFLKSRKADETQPDIEAALGYQVLSGQTV